jgi:hypothetical protein
LERSILQQSGIKIPEFVDEQGWEYGEENDWIDVDNEMDEEEDLGENMANGVRVVHEFEPSAR